MERFRYLPHTADMRFRSYGKGFGEALENAALALLNAMLDIKRIEASKSRNMHVAIKERADTESQLVWFTLQDILSKVDSRKLNAYAFRIVSLKASKDGLQLKGMLLFKSTPDDNAMLSVKAITPHGLDVRKHKGRVTINVVADV
jgi:SHS2 domain-containing protein